MPQHSIDAGEHWIQYSHLYGPSLPPMANVARSQSWILSQIESLLGPPARRYDLAFGGFVGVWMLRLAAALAQRTPPTGHGNI